MESQDMSVFKILKASEPAARLGTLTLRNRSAIQTPTFFGNTSRGAVPHITQDMQRDNTSIQGVYMAWEDYAERAPPEIPPILQYPTESREESKLRKFTAHTEPTTLILGPRRFPAVETPVSNSNTGIAICTAVGFRTMEVHEYIEAAEILQPDIMIAPADVPVLAGDFVTSQKRRERMTDRTTRWLRDTITQRLKSGIEEQPSAIRPHLFAPVLPIDASAQAWYLRELPTEEILPHLSGLALYDTQVVPDLPKELNHLPRLSLAQSSTPHEILRAIALGTDIFVLPFVTAASDVGVVFDFEFPPAANQTATPVNGQLQSPTDSLRRPLGHDARDSSHATALTPPVAGCECYACTAHHRAYMHHLLNAKEMLAWVLLQVHNHHIMDKFFAGVRESINRASFEKDMAAFERAYESSFPITEGVGPRVRGYQVRSKGRGEAKKNRKAYNRLDDTAVALAPSSSGADDPSQLEGQ